MLACVRKTGFRSVELWTGHADHARGAGEAAAIRRAADDVGVALDTGHLVAAGERPAGAFARLGERVFDVHLKDVVVAGPLRRWLGGKPRMEGRPVGAGEADLAAFLAALVRADYRGFVVIEDERVDMPLSELPASLRAATGLLRET